MTSKISQGSTSEKTFTKRALILAGGQIGLMGLLGGRLLYLGGVRSHHYQTLSLENRVRLRLTLPERGRLLDRHQMPLADNRISYRLVCYPGESRDLSKIVKAFFSLSFTSEDGLTPDALLKKMRSYPRFSPVVLKENLSWDEICEVEVKTAHLSSLHIEKGQRRHYPKGEIFAHLVGYVQTPSPSDTKQDLTPLLKLPDYRVGKKGVEKSFEKEVQGTPGYKEVEVNAQGRLVRELNKHPAQKGADLTLSLESRLQKKSHDLLTPHKSGSLVLLDIPSGQVLALASTPSFNPNLFVDGISHENWNALRDNPYSPLANKAIQGLYSPGSLFKMVVALAGLEAGLLKEKEAHICQGYTEIGQHRYHCWRRHGHGKMTLHQALRESCDVYFYDLALKVGIDRIQSMAHQLGLGNPTGIELVGEKGGLIPGKDWKRATRQASWTLGDTVLSSIGQGAMLTTPLQLAVMMARLVGKGQAISPTLQNKTRPPFSRLPLQPHHLSVIKKAMDSAVNHPAGTIYRYRIQDKMFAMGGKSGTTQVRRISLTERQKRVRRNEELPWKLRDHALFAGYAPLNDPRFAVCVVIEHGGGGSRIAGPLARDLLLYAQQELLPL